MQDDSHTDGRVTQLASGLSRSRASRSSSSNPGSHESAVQDDRARGRSATHPLEVPARGWKTSSSACGRTLARIGSLWLPQASPFIRVLALFPAIAALVAVYGFFADPTTIASHLDSIAGFVPGGAIEVIRDQITRVASQGDALNLVYNEPEKRSFIWLNVISLSFTVLTIMFALVAIGTIVVVPVVLNFLGLGSATELIFKIARWPALLIVVIRRC